MGSARSLFGSPSEGSDIEGRPFAQRSLECSSSCMFDRSIVRVARLASWVDGSSCAKLSWDQRILSALTCLAGGWCTVASNLNVR